MEAFLISKSYWWWQMVMVWGNSSYLCTVFPLKRPNLLVYTNKLRSPIFSSCCILRKKWHTKNKELEGEKSEPQVRGVGSLSGILLGVWKRPPPHPYPRPYFACLKPDILQWTSHFLLFFFNSFTSIVDIEWCKDSQKGHTHTYTVLTLLQGLTLWPRTKTWHDVC